MYKKNIPYRLLISSFFISILFSFNFSCNLYAQAEQDSVFESELLDGLNYYEIKAPLKSIVNDSKLYILKINPEKFDFYLLCASENGKQNRTASEWAEEFCMDVTVNAGMFSLIDFYSNGGYMKNYEHLNNPKLKENYNVMIALNPKDSAEKSLQLYDLTCQNWDSIKDKYHSYSQGMRMIDCNGNALSWNKRATQSCSMVIAATDDIGNVYFIFTRSPYTHNTVISFILSLSFNIKTTVYLEGGPETSLFINTGDTKIEMIGSYLSRTFQNDNNDHFWKIPNVIGIKKK